MTSSAERTGAAVDGWAVVVWKVERARGRVLILAGMTQLKCFSDLWCSLSLYSQRWKPLQISRCCSLWCVQESMRFPQVRSQQASAWHWKLVFLVLTPLFLYNPALFMRIFVVFWLADVCVCVCVFVLVMVNQLHADVEICSLCIETIEQRKSYLPAVDDPAVLYRTPFKLQNSFTPICIFVLY